MTQHDSHPATPGYPAVQRPSGMPFHRYSAYPTFDLPDRTWPQRTISRAPQWCSVDLRDGNQALIDPMDPERKLRMFELLVRLGYKEIEIGYPTASQADFDFTRRLVEEDRVPDDVVIQVVSPSREEWIERTFQALRGARSAIVNLYNSTSALQRRVVFGLDRKGVRDLAVAGATQCLKHAQSSPGTDFYLQYSVESYTGTEPDFALEICNAVNDVWQPTPDHKTIMNLPATVETSTPNIYADSIEWMHRNLNRRQSTVLSLHPHNDRGSAVAAAELGYLAGAERIEGCLYGNGERTGNVCLVTLGLNLFSQGIDPMVDLSDVDAIRSTVEACNRIPVHPRHPYGGELVYTAFSGTHQDAINKGLLALEREAEQAGTSLAAHPWAVPYLPIDPRDVGRTYEAVVRVNSQSGKGAIAYVLRTHEGLELPRPLQIEFSRVIQEAVDNTGTAISPEQILELFRREYLERVPGASGELSVDGYRRDAEEGWEFAVRYGDTSRRLTGAGHNEPESGLVDALAALGVSTTVLDRTEHTRPTATGAETAVYVQCRTGDLRTWGIGIAIEPAHAALRAVASAVTRANRSTGR